MHQCRSSYAHRHENAPKSLLKFWMLCQHVVFWSISCHTSIALLYCETFRLVYCAIGEASKSEIVGVLQPPALAMLTVRIETEVKVIEFEARRKCGHCNYPNPIWQSRRSRSTYPFLQDLTRSPVRTLLTASLNRGATPWVWTEARMGVRLLGRAMLGQTVVAAIIYGFVGTDKSKDFDHFAK